jgi:hypothetical protein
MLAQRGRRQADGIGRFRKSRDREHSFEAAGGVMIDFFRDDFEGLSVLKIVVNSSLSGGRKGYKSDLVSEALELGEASAPQPTRFSK